MKRAIESVASAYPMLKLFLTIAFFVFELGMPLIYVLLLRASEAQIRAKRADTKQVRAKQLIRAKRADTSEASRYERSEQIRAKRADTSEASRYERSELIRAKRADTSEASRYERSEYSIYE